MKSFKYFKPLTIFMKCGDITLRYIAPGYNSKARYVDGFYDLTIDIPPETHISAIINDERGEDEEIIKTIYLELDYNQVIIHYDSTRYVLHPESISFERSPFLNVNVKYTESKQPDYAVNEIRYEEVKIPYDAKRYWSENGYSINNLDED